MFSNILPGPVIGIPHLNMLKDIVEDSINNGFIFTAYITNKEHEAYKMYKQSRPQENPVGILITLQYKENYD